MATWNHYCAKPGERRVLPSTLKLEVAHKTGITPATLPITMTIRGRGSPSIGWDLETVTYEGFVDPNSGRGWQGIINPGVCTRGDTWAWNLVIYNSQRVAIATGRLTTHLPYGTWNMLGAELVANTTR